MASAAKSAPAAFNPFSAMKTSPGFTWRESYARPRTSIPGSAASFSSVAEAFHAAPSCSSLLAPATRRRLAYVPARAHTPCPARSAFRRRRLARHDAVAREPRSQPDLRQDTQRFARAQPAEIRQIAHVAVRADRNDRRASRRLRRSESPAARCAARRAPAAAHSASAARQGAEASPRRCAERPDRQSDRRSTHARAANR